MKNLVVVLLLVPLSLFGQRSDTLDLNSLVREALQNNPALKALNHDREMMEARAEQSGLLSDPELTFMREEMPGFRWNEAQFQRIEMMQMFPFPGKLSNESEIAEIQAEHAHHEYIEQSNELLARLRSMYYELWFLQQSILLNRESRRLLDQFAAIARTRYSVGQVSQQDVLKSFVEIAKLDNQLIALRQKESSAKAMLMAILNRDPSDSLGIAVVPARTDLLLSLDSLVQLAMRFRGMIMHDSLSIQENELMLALARKQYLPDFKLGATYVTMPGMSHSAWTLSAGINLPFAPWSLQRNSAIVDEATIGIEKARASLNSSRAMVRSNISDLVFKALSLTRQLENFERVIVPQSDQALRASTTAYQTGKTDFLMLIDSYRMLIELSMEKLMLRMQREQVIAQLKKEVGYTGIFASPDERN